MSEYILDGYHLTLEQTGQILADPHPQFQISPEAEERCRRSRAQIDRWLQEGAPAIYGINTGLGALKDVAVPAEKHEEWNLTLPYPHSAGFGRYLPPATTRMALLLRANLLCRGYSAARPELIRRILDLVQAGIGPAVFAEGSTGLSDLAPMAQCVMTVAGLPEAKAFYQGRLMSSREACRAAGLPEEFPLQCKEVLMQMNGSTMSQAISLTAYHQICQLLPRLEAHLASGERETELLSACREALAFIGSVLELENNISCDNPLLFEVEDGQYEAVMGCNCSNTQVGYAMDLLNILLAELAQEVEAVVPGSREAQLCRQLKVLTMQVSADSIPTKGGQEDHVEFSYTAARKAEQGTELLARLLDAAGWAGGVEEREAKA